MIGIAYKEEIEGLESRRAQSARAPGKEPGARFGVDPYVSHFSEGKTVKLSTDRRVDQRIDAVVITGKHKLQDDSRNVYISSKKR